MSGSTGRGYSFRISADGMQEFAADMRRLSGESEGAQRAFSKLIQASPELASGLLRAEEATKRAADRARDLQQANERAAASAAALPAATARAAQGFDAMEGRVNAARRGINDFRGALELLGAGGVASALGPVAGQIGNIADLFGTASLASGAFGSGVSGLTSLLGPLAAGIGLVGGAAYALSLSYEAVARRQEEVRAGEEAYRRAMEQSATVLRTNADLIETTAEARRREAIAANESAIAIERENLARANEAASRASATRARLEEVAATGRDVSAGLGRARTAEAGIATAAEAISQRIAALEANIAQLRLVQYNAPIGPQPQVARPSDPPGSGRSSEAGRALTVSLSQEIARQEQEAEQARERIAAAERRELERRERENARVTDNITRYLADGFTDAFRAGGSGFSAMLRAMRDLAVSTPIRIGVEAAVRPVVSSAVSGISSAVSSAGGLGQILGMSGAGSSISSALGLSGMASGAVGLLSTPLWGSGGLTGAQMAAPGMFAEAAPASMGMTVAPTLGGALVGIGGGYMIGSTIGGMIARTDAQRTNANIGAGIGAGIGFVVGGPVGGLIGGAIGGAGGGMIGPSRANTFYNLGVSAGDDGRLSITDSGGKRAEQQLAALTEQTQQQITALNQQLSALGLTVSGRAELGANVTGLQQFGSLADAGGQFRLTAADARIQGAIDRAGGTLNALGAAQQASDLIGALSQITRAAEDAANPITAITRQFDGLREAASRLGFGFEEVQAAQRRAIGAALAPSISGLADYARGLRTANDNAGNPMSRLAAAEADFQAVASRAQGGDMSALGRLQASAETFRGLSRQVFGTGAGFADAESRITAALESIGNLNADQLTASVLAAETRNQTQTLVDVLQRELGRLQAEVAALRREAQQQGANPLVARAA